MLPTLAFTVNSFKIFDFKVSHVLNLSHLILSLYLCYFARLAFPSGGMSLTFSMPKSLLHVKFVLSLSFL